MIQGEPVSPILQTITKDWDVSTETLDEWGRAFNAKYGDLFDEETVHSLVLDVRNEFFAQATSLGQFCALLERCQLIPLCQETLKTRTDGFLSVLQKQLPEERLQFLNEADTWTGEKRIVHAIHLGLLGEVGTCLGSDGLAQLLCRDEATTEFYAGVLVGYADDERLGSWWSTLSDVDKDLLTKAICEIASEDLEPSLTERFTLFLRGLDEKEPAVRSLCRAVFALKSTAVSAQLEAVLQTWLAKHASNKLAPTIWDKIQELGLNVAEASSNDARTISPSSSSEEALSSARTQSPLITFETLPDDPTGTVLEQFEIDGKAPAEGRQVTLDLRTNLFGSGVRGDEPSEFDIVRHRMRLE